MAGLAARTDPCDQCERSCPYWSPECWVGRLQGAHAGNVKVLAKGDGVAEPGQVADVEQDGGLGRRTCLATGPNDLLAKQVLKTDVDADELVCDGRGLCT